MDDRANSTQFVRPSKVCANCAAPFYKPATYSYEQWSERRCCGSRCSIAYSEKLRQNDTKACLQCGSTITRPKGIGAKAWGRRRYCCHACSVRSRVSIGGFEDFLALTRERNGCLEWVGPVDDAGYGRTGWGSRRWAAHRLSWLFHKGEDPGEMWVCHHCDNPRCVKVGHLYLGTVRENTDDRVTRGRHPEGQHSTSAKLTNEQARRIKRRLQAGDKGTAIAREYGVSQSTISLINRGLRYTNA